MVAGCASVGREGGERGQNLVGGRRANSPRALPSWYAVAVQSYIISFRSGKLIYNKTIFSYAEQ